MAPGCPCQSFPRSVAAHRFPADLYRVGGLPVYWYWIPGLTLVNLVLVRIITWLMTLLYCVLFLYQAGKRGLFSRPVDQDFETSGKGR
jgi:hypothetical protein